MKIIKKNRVSQGDGSFELSQFKSVGENVVIEKGVLVFHPENIIIGSNVYIGHNSILKGYYKNLMVIGDNAWIGQNCYFHSAGGLKIGKYVGIGPMVKIITSQHEMTPVDRPIITNKLNFRGVIIEDECDIGTGAIVLPGVTIGKSSVIGAGAVVTKSVPSFVVSVGNPAKLLKSRR